MIHDNTKEQESTLDITESEQKFLKQLKKLLLQMKKLKPLFLQLNLLKKKLNN